MPAAGPSSSFSFGLAAFAALISFLVYSQLLQDNLPAVPTVQCTKAGFLGLGCQGKGCVRRSGQCVPVDTSSSTTASSTAAAAASKADSLMRKRTVANCLAAADQYEAAAKAAANGGSVQTIASYQLKAGDAINCAMRIHGTGNILLLDGTLDTPANKKFWGTHGPRALGLIKAARASHAPYASDAAATAMEMDAFMYSSSSKGIIKQALTGAGVTFKALADELTYTYSSWDGYVGHCYLGGFFWVAPWPIGNKAKGVENFEAAFKAEPKSRRNGYYACLMRYHAGDYDGAVQACQTAVNRGSCDGPTTGDYCGFLTEQANKVLALARSKR